MAQRTAHKFSGKNEIGSQDRPDQVMDEAVNSNTLCDITFGGSLCCRRKLGERTN